MWSTEPLESDRDLRAASALLDAVRMQSVVDDALLAAASSDFRIEFVRYKPGVDLTVLYAFEAGGEPTFVHARAFALPGRLDEVAEKSDRQRRLGRSFSRPVARIDDPEAVLFAFPNDSEIPGLRLLAERESVARIVTKRCPEFAAVDPRSVTAAVVRYRPESRCVCRAEFETPAGTRSVMVKAFGGEAAFRRAVNAADAAIGDRSSRERFHLAPTVGSYARRRIVVTERLDVASFEHLADSGRLPDFDDLGRRLALWHGPVVDEGRSVTELSMRDTLSGWLPHVDDASVRETWEHVLAFPALERAGRHRIHGDFHAGQVLASTPPTLIDMDGWTVDTPLADLATFLAVELTRKRGGPPADALRRFVEGYRSAAPARIEAERLRRFVALAVLDRSASGLSKLRRSWRRRLEAGAARARDVLAGRDDVI